MNERKMTVKGMGRLSLKPDLIIITVTLETKNEDYKKAVDAASVQINALKDALEAAGFQRDSLKTTDFRVNTEYDNIQDGRAWRQVFVGYKCAHMLRLEFDMDIKRLDRAIFAMSSCGSAPHFEIGFSVKDKNAASERLLTNAVTNARKNAEVLAAAAGVVLGDIISINYSNNEVNFFSKTRMTRAVYASAGGCVEECDDNGIEPEDIKINDTVEIVWGIN